ncbi:hypothetical protein [Nostoc sp.]|uniref:hypothetical protein n=1 Tax=Nostoc sp. TaxID=1180 RepID=UPI003FA5D1A1
MMAKPSSRRKKATSAAEINSKSLSNSANADISVEENPATATITVTAVEVSELTEQEQRDCLHLERKVERHFLKRGRRWRNYAIADYTVQVTARLKIIAAIALGIVSNNQII